MVPMVRPGRGARRQRQNRQRDKKISFHGSFPQHGFDADPERAERSGDNDGDGGAPAGALDLFDALAPFPKVAKIRLQLAAIFFLDAERGQNRGDGL
jgi:hypothetical protein